MVDGVLHLTDELSELRPLRHIRVLKLRGSAPLRGLHSVRITDNGLEVRPRIETLFLHAAVDDASAASGAKLSFGVAELDAMLRGGVRQGSITMLLGSSGSGKTLLGMQFLSEGLKRGERSLYFGFYERPETILAKCQRVGIGGLTRGVEDGLGGLDVIACRAHVRAERRRRKSATTPASPGDERAVNGVGVGALSARS